MPNKYTKHCIDWVVDLCHDYHQYISYIHQHLAHPRVRK
jgi:hypothetical protein